MGKQPVSKRTVIAAMVVALMTSGCASSAPKNESGVSPSSQPDSSKADASQSDEDGPDEDGPDEDRPDEDRSNEDRPDGGAAGGTMAGSSPIGALFDEGGGLDAALAEYRVKVEEKIVVCMARQGFEFVQSAPEVAEMDRLQGELTTREWTEQFGYGISTSFETVATNRAGDPNSDIYFAMSPGEREIWTEVLTGAGGIAAALGGGSALPLEQQGCIGAALIETGGGDIFEGMQDFGDAYAEAEAALDDRREMINAVDAWTRCMSGRGYPDLADRNDPETHIGERFNKIVAPLVASLSDLDSDAARSFIEGDNVQLDDFPNLDVDGLRELQLDEIGTAIADLDCYEEHVQGVYEPLRDDLENGLITEFQGELEALRTIGS